MRKIALNDKETAIFEREVVSGVVKSERFKQWVSVSCIIKDAEMQAKVIAKTSQENIEKAIKQGYGEGFANGLAKFSSEIKEMHEVQKRNLQETKDDVINLTRLCTQKVINNIGSEIFLKKVIDDAFIHMAGAEPIRITCAPDCVRNIENHVSSLFGKKIKPGMISVIGKGDMDPLSCRIVTRTNVLDANADTQLETLIKVLEENRFEKVMQNLPAQVNQNA